MGRHSRRSRRGGDKIDDIQSQLDSIQQQVNELKGSSSGANYNIIENCIFDKVTRQGFIIR